MRKDLLKRKGGREDVPAMCPLKIIATSNRKSEKASSTPNENDKLRNKTQRPDAETQQQRTNNTATTHQQHSNNAPTNNTASSQVEILLTISSTTLKTYYLGGGRREEHTKM